MLPAQLIGHYLYVAGGYANGFQAANMTRNVDRFDVLSNTWAPVAPLPQPRTQGAAGVLENYGQLIVTGGNAIESYSYPEVSAKTLAYDPVRNVWVQKRNMIANRRDHAVAVLGDYLYVLGGVRYCSTGTLCDSADLDHLTP